MSKQIQSFLQLLIGSLFDISRTLDRIKPASEHQLYLGAVSASCFGLFANMATIVVLLWAGLTWALSTHIEFPATTAGKIAWAVTMAIAYIWLVSSREKILAANRVRITKPRLRAAFLVTYFALTYAALVGSAIVYSGASPIAQ